MHLLDSSFKVNIDSKLFELGYDNTVTINEQALKQNVELSINAQRLFRVLISLIDKDDLPGKYYIFKIKDYARLFNISSKPYKQLEDAAKELGKRFTIRLENPDGTYFSYTSGWLNDAQITQGEVWLRFDEHFLPLYLKLQQCKYSIANTVNFSTSSAFTFYEVFLNHLGTFNTAELYMSIDEIQVLLKLNGKYIKKSDGCFDYGAFKRFTLNKVDEQINDPSPLNPCNIRFTYTEHKPSRRITGITFHITRIRDNDVLPLISLQSDAYLNLMTDGRKAYDYLIKIGVSKSIVENLLQLHGEKNLISLALYVFNNRHLGKLYMAAAIKNVWISDEPIIHYDDSFTDLDKYLHFSSDEILLTNEQHIKAEEFLYHCEHALGINLYSKTLDYLRSVPRIYRYFEHSTLLDFCSLNELKPFFLDAILKISQSPTLKTIFKNFKPSKSLVDYPIHFIERQSVIDALKSYNIVSQSTITSLLNYSDKRILDNIKYVNEHYVKRRNLEPEKIAGLIITSIRFDYVGSDSSCTRSISPTPPSIPPKVDTEINSMVYDEVKQTFYSLSPEDQLTVTLMAYDALPFLKLSLKTHPAESLWSNNAYINAIANATQAFLRKI